MAEINSALLLLGSNIEPRLEFIDHAADILKSMVGKVCQRSSIYESEAWGFESDQKFLNQLLFMDTYLSPTDLLECILSIENQLGRTRSAVIKYGSRNIDIDILYFNDEVIKIPKLIIPHPRLHERRFALLPLTEVIPDYIHPVIKKSNLELLDCLDDPTEVIVFKEKLHDEI